MPAPSSSNVAKQMTSEKQHKGAEGVNMLAVSSHPNDKQTDSTTGEKFHHEVTKY
jgi:hypothetical protein